MAIKIKDLRVLEELLSAEFHPNLIELLKWLSVRLSDVVITSAYRKDDKGVHGTKPCRAVDIRSWIYPNPEQIAEDINKHWVYDPDRPWKEVCIYHDTGSGLHFHLQVHPKTFYATKEDDL